MCAKKNEAIPARRNLLWRESRNISPNQQSTNAINMNFPYIDSDASLTTARKTNDVLAAVFDKAARKGLSTHDATMYEVAATRQIELRMTV
jgi:hypothetical protein